jgi:hypothetical protein
LDTINNVDTKREREKSKEKEHIIYIYLYICSYVLCILPVLIYALHNQWIQLQECGARNQPITQSQPTFHLFQGFRCYHASSRHLKWVGIPYMYIYICIFVYWYVYIYMCTLR